jgi:hypothetical protein
MKPKSPIGVSMQESLNLDLLLESVQLIPSIKRDEN